MATIFEQPIVVQGETLAIIAGGGDASLYRTQTANQERDGQNGLGNDAVPDATDNNPGLPEFDDYGLRPDYTGTGYFDINGSAGSKASFTFDAEPGTYEVTIRVANGSGPRELKLITDAGESALVPTATGEFFLWGLRTFTIEVGNPAGTGALQPHTVEIATIGSNGPNIDALAIANVGRPISFVPPVIAADPMQILENELLVGQVAASDKDGQTLTYSLTDGAENDLFELTEAGVLSFKSAPDFEAARSNIYEVEIAATDGVEAAVQTISVVVGDDPEVPEPAMDQVLAQGEAGVIAPVTGAETLHRVQSDPATAESGAPATDVSGDPFDAFGLRIGYTGTGYTDFNGSGESVSWTVAVDAAGAYDLHLRFASTDNAADLRPLDLSVDGGEPQRLEFQGTGFENWIERAPVRVVLSEGPNTITLAIPSGFSNGPNIDAIVVTSTGAAPDFTPPAFVAPVDAVEYAENGTGAVADFGAVDPDAGDTVTYALEGADAGDFDISDAGVLTFGAVPDHEFPADADGDNIYDVIVAATAVGTTARQTLSVTVTDVDDDGPTGISLAAQDVAENVAGAIVAVITVDGGTPSVGEFTTSDDATYRVVEEDGVLTLRLQPTVSLNRESDAQPSVTVFLNDLASAEFAPDPSDVDEAPVLGATTQPVDENDASGAVVASITVDDPDLDAAYGVNEFEVSDTRFEVIEQDGFKLALKDGQSLNFEAGAPTVTVTLAGVSVDVVPDVNNLAETLQILFDQDAITAYGTRQDRPDQGGTGVTVAGGVGGAITLDGNLWKRAAIDPFTIEPGTVLRVTIDVAVVGEAVGIGFDLDDDPFDSDFTVYQVAGPQTVNRFVDIRTPASTNATGEFTFEIDLSAHAGASVSSLVLVADDDASSNGLGKVTFSNVEILAPQDGGNADPRVVGGGVADFAIDEGSTVEVDLPFVDDDGDALTYTLEVRKDGVLVTDFPASISGGVLSGALGETAPGVYEITTTATDDRGGAVATDTFLLTVENVNQAPQADPNLGFEPYFGKVGEEIISISLADFAGAFSDPDGDALVLSATDLPAGLVFDADEGVIYGTPTEPGDGTFTVVATEVGAEGLTASIEVVLEIDAPSLGDSITIEAEDFTGLGNGSTGFFATGQAGASGDRLIRTNPNVDGAVETVLSAGGVTPGWYTVAITVYDELDGDAAFSLSVGDVELTADGASYSDEGVFTNPEAGRGNAGQLGNRKTISFTKEVYVDAGTVLSLSGTADGELLRTDSITLTRVEMPNEAPEAVVLTGDPVAENADGATVGVLSSADPDGDTALIVYSVDAGSIFEVVGDELRLKSGESLDFEAGATVSVDVTATDAAGAATTTTLTIAVADVNEAPVAVTLTGSTVAENAPGAVIGTLGAVDPEDGALTFSVTDPRFVVEDATLRLADGVSLDHEAGETVSIAVDVTDGANTVTQSFDVTVTDVNEAPELGTPAALTDVTAAFATESRTDLTVLGATDPEGDDVTFGVRSGTADALPAGIEVVGDELVVGASTPAGTYAVEVFATDGQLESDSVLLNVAVGEPAPFETIILQAETFTLIPDATAATGDDNLIRTETQNWERDGSPLNPEPNDTAANPNDETFTEIGLRPGYTGTGYLDINGTDEGPQASFTFDAPAGTYDLTVRYANGSGTQSRPMSFTLGGETQTIAETRTNVDGVANTGWYNWQTAVLTFEVTGPGPHTVTVGQANGQGAPNIDAIAISLPGEPVVFLDESADADEVPLALAGPADEVAAADVGAIDFTVTGRDADIVKVEISFDGGTTRTDVTADLSPEGTFSVDGSALGAGAQTATIIVTDGAGNQADETFDFTIAGNEPVDSDPVTIQAEDGTQVTVTDVGAPGTGPDGRAITQVIGAGEQDAFGNDRENAVGDAFVDFGEDPGDKIDIAFNAPAAGTYSFTVTYAMGANDARVLALSVNGAVQENISFTNSGGWDTYADITVEVALGSGPNTVTLEIPTAANGGTGNGPNIDQVTFAAADVDVDPDVPSEPGERETIRINFQDGTAPKAEGYLVANFDGYQARANGETYGFVTEASVYDADTASNTPIDGSRYPAVAINERSGTGENGGIDDGVNFDAFDPRLTGYAHTDLGSYPGAQDDPNERVAFELAVENGWYEVTVAVGDTGGPNDSDNKLEIEGVLVSDFVPTEDYKTQLVTAQVEVTDGNLTLAAPNGTITEFQYLDVRALPDLTPDDDRPAPADYSAVGEAFAASGVGTTFTEVPITAASGPIEGIDPTAAFTMGLDLAAGRSGVLLSSLNNGSIKIVETLTGAEVGLTVNTSGGFDTLTISPTAPLKEFTSYTLIIDGLLDRGAVNDLDAPSREFQKSTFTFTTKELPEVVDREVAFQDTLEYRSNPAQGEVYTSIEISPDGTKLYTASLAGTLTRWDIDPADGSIDTTSKEVFFPAELNEAGARRGIIGLVFDPEDPNVIWVTDNYPVPLTGRDNGVPEFSGAVSKVTLGDGGSFEGATFETYITGLPRSNGDHVTNSLEFRNVGTADVPEYKLYLIQGSNSAMGEQDKAWGFRPERLLNASVMEIDHKRTDVPEGGFDVSTEPVPQDGLNRRYEYTDTINNGDTLAPTDDGDLKNGGLLIDDGPFVGNYLHFDERGVATVRTGEDASSAIVDGGDFYDPFADDAVLKIFATGQRNAYDLVWHSNGFLYAPTNGSASGGNAPDNPDTDANEAAFGIERQDDYLFIVEEGSYSGHPNALRNEFILNGGNPTGGSDPNQVNKYPVGTQPEANYDPSKAYSLGPNRSPNGAVEYTSDVFGANLKGAIIFAEYSNDNNLRAILLDENGLPIAEKDFALQRPDGSDIQSSDPLDVVQDSKGRLYVVTLERDSGTSNIIRLDPAPGGVVSTDGTADAGGDLSLSVVDGTDASNVIFEVTGLDDDIETITVTFDGGTTTTPVTLDGQGRFTANLSGATGVVTAQLVVQDEVPNTARASITFTPGDTSASKVIDASTFTNLDAPDTVIRLLSDPLTHEPTNSNDSNGDGMNDGYDGAGYLDPNGGAEPKASFIFDADGAGTYEFSFRMASSSSRSVAIEVNGQSVPITVNTTSFTNWSDFPITLTLEDGPNTITIRQTTAQGPNIDSVTVTPINVVPVEDLTADEGDDLAVALTDASDRAATVFTVTGADADIESYLVSFDGGATLQAVTVTGGQFTADTRDLSGDVTISLTVADEVPNTKTVTTQASFDAVVANDGTAVIGGVAYVLYEAENAALDGAVVVPETTVDRDAQGTGFVDFDGTTDQSITWTISVGADGTYAADILYALSPSKDARPMTLSVDGTVVDTLGFVPNSSVNEDVWGPQGFSLDLTAGIHTITVTAPGADGPNVDQLRISAEPQVPGDPDADIEIRSLDAAFFDDRLHFSWLENDNAVTSKDGNAVGPRDYKESAEVEISNSGTNDLVFSSATITGPFELADPSVFDGLTLGAGESRVVKVLFDRDAYTSGPSSVTGVFEGALTLRTNDAEDRVATVDLAGFWQARDEGGWEPNVNEVWKVFGFGNFIEGLSLNGGGENSVLNRWDLYIAADETEVLSPYFRIADGETEARVTQIAAFHGPGGANLSVHAPGDKNAAFVIGAHAGDQNQTLLPLKGNGQFLTGTFDAGTVPDAWDGEDVFGFRMAGLSSDPTLNPSDADNPSQAELNDFFPGYTVDTAGQVFDPAGTPVEDGYTVRMFQAVDENGVAIPNVFLGVMDYTGINYDYNDNMFIVEGVTPVSTSGAAVISGLDDAAADDRLVFTNIETPANGTQQFRNEATFTISNAGLGELKVTGISFAGTDANSFEVVGALPSSIAEGASAKVTIRFIGTDEDAVNAADLHQATMSVQTSGGSKMVALAGLAQSLSESGQEPTVAQIVEAFGYTTDVAQSSLNGLGDVEVVGDEVLMPYLERLDGSKPVEVINLAAFLQQGNISRLNLHELESDALTELFAGDDQQGQTVLPDGLVPGAGDTGSVGRGQIDRDAPFGLKVTVDGRPTFAAWTDPAANVADPKLGVNDEGHYIRFFQAKDGAGNDIPGTFIGIQDYPGGKNFDYNDAMFLVTNVQPHVLTAANDSNANGVNDALETDADGDGLAAFFDADDAATGGGGEPAKGDYVVGFNVGGGAVGAQEGLGGVALRGDGDALISYAGDGATRAPGTDNAGNPNGANALSGAFQTYRDGTDWTATVSGLIDGEYVVVLHTQETYHDASGERIFDLRIDGVTVADDLDPFAVAGGDAGVAITALVQVTGGSFTVALDSVGSDGVDNAALNAITVFQSAANPGGGLAAPGNAAPTTTGIAGVPEATEGEAFSFDVSGFFDDPDADDTLTFAAALPAGLTISGAGVISGTPVEDGSFAITVTATDGQASVSSSFTLEVGDAPAAAVQSPFGGTAPTIGADAVFVDAGTFDEGGQGVSWNDDPGLNGTQTARTDTDVELVGPAQDIGYVEAGEWVEYTVNVAEAGTYDLSVIAKTPIGGNTVTVSIEGGAPLATFALPDSNGAATSFTGTTFAETPAQQVSLAAGEQTIRVAFDGSPASNGYLLDYRGLTLDKVEGAAAPGPIGEAGSLTVAQAGPGAWTSVAFSQALDDPSVVVGPLTTNDGSPATVRVRNVTDTGFEVQIDEWDYLDGIHAAEKLQWIALEAGTHEIDGRTVVAGSGTATGDDSALSFGTDAFGSGPLVFAQVASDMQANAVTAQVNSVSSTGFVLDLDRQERDQRDLGLAHGTETVDWIAVEAGGHASDGSFSGLKANVTTRGVAVGLPLSGSVDDFVFIADMQQEAGIDTATVRLKSVSNDSWTLFIEEEKSRDTELNHALENVGYFGIETGLIFEDISIV